MIGKIVTALNKEYPAPKLDLDFKNPFQLLVASILAAQTRDEWVNKVTPVLFSSFHTPADFLKPGADSAVGSLISSINFYRKKLATILSCCKLLVEEHGGSVPRDPAILATFPGIGRKTAAMVVANAYDIPAVFVDTHVLRVSGRLGLTGQSDPGKAGDDIEKLVDRKQWKEFCLLLISHGKRVCLARGPLCGQCCVRTYCIYYKETTGKK